MGDSQNLTIRLSRQTVRRARRVAAARGSSISALVTEKIEEIAGEDAAYEAARRRALRWLGRGFHLGGRAVARDVLHER